MNTSCFENYKGANAVSICLKPPFWYKGKQYRELAPPYWLLIKYKKDRDKNFYIEHYHREVLDKLDPQIVYNTLGEDAILLCWEKPGEFCHRRLIAQWLEWELGIEVNEL